jgi:hypothetical protein
MTMYHVQIVASALQNRSVASFKVDQAQLGAAIAAVLDVPRWVTAWIGLTDQRDDAELYSKELVTRLKAKMAEPFVLALETATAEDPTGRANAMQAASEILARVGGEVRERAGALEVYLPGRSEPEVLLLYAAADTLPCLH